MATVINRGSSAILRSVNTPDFPVIDWIINPDLSSVSGVPEKFLKITGDTISQMSLSEKQTILDSELVARRNSAISEMDNKEGMNRQILRLMLREINILRGRLSMTERTFTQLRSEIRNGYGK